MQRLACHTKLQMNFEIALAGYDMTVLNVILHYGLRNSVAYIILCRAAYSILNS